MHNPINAITVTCTSDTCFANQTWGQFRFINSNSNSSQLKKNQFQLRLAKINSNSNFLNPRLRKNYNPIRFNTVLFVLEIMCARSYLIIFNIQRIYLPAYLPTCPPAYMPTHSLTGLVVTVDRAWETSHIYLTATWNINGMIQFVNINNELTVYVERNNASNILFTKSDFN